VFELRLFCVSACVTLLAAGAPLRAHAGPEEDKNAAARFHEGERAYAAGDYRKAAEAFELAYAAKPHHAPLWNAARSRERSGEPVRAANLLEKYLHDAPTGARDRDQATLDLVALTNRLGRIEVRTAEASQIRVDDVASDASLVYVTPGEHIVTGISGDVPLRRLVTVRAGEVVSVSLTPPAEGQRPPPSFPVPQPRSQPQPRHGLPLPLFIGTASLTLLAGTFVAISGADTVQGKNAFVRNPTQERLDSAFSAQTRTNILVATTAILGAATLILAYFTQLRKPPEPLASDRTPWFEQRPKQVSRATTGALTPQGAP
jgi:hypothetical protein